MSGDTDDKGFLSRWSERKAAVKDAEKSDITDEIELQEPDQDSVPAELEDAALSPDGEPEFIPTEEDVEKLDINSDFSQFLKKSVPQHIKRMALQKLWRTDPAYGVIDGLLEYGEDYSDLHKKGAVIQSAYQAGKGYFSRDKEADDEAVEEVAAKPADDEAGIVEDTISEDADTEAVEATTEGEDSAVGTQEDVGDGEDDFA